MTIDEVWNYIETLRRSVRFSEIDGMVIKVTLPLKKEIGFTVKHHVGRLRIIPGRRSANDCPRYQWTAVGRGVITPTAVMDPVQLGTTVRRAGNLY